jgi:hypothetical protein
MPWLTETHIPDVDARVEDGRLIVTQIQSGALYDLPLDVDLVTAGGTVRRAVHLVARADTLDVRDAGAVSEVRVDPDHYFLTRRHWGEVARFALRAPQAKAVELTGNFEASPITATRDGDLWTASTPLSEGRYIWIWRVDGKTPSDEDAIAAVASGSTADTIRAGVRTVRPTQRLEPTHAQ